MVSNTLGLTLEELVAKLGQFTVEYADDPDFKELRSGLPEEFPF